MTDQDPDQRRRTGSGIPPAPFIEENVTELDVNPFNFQLSRGPTAQVLPGSGGGGGDGITGACCDEFGGCTITTEAECTGTFKGVGTVCDPNPCCCACPAEETLTIDITFTGITFCDPEIYGYTGDPNGTFTLTRLDTIDFHGWFGTGSTDIEYFGDPQPPPLIQVECFPGNIFELVLMGPSGGEFFSTAEGCPPTTANTQTCDGGYAFGGTATIDCGP